MDPGQNTERTILNLRGVGRGQTYPPPHFQNGTSTLVAAVPSFASSGGQVGESSIMCRVVEENAWRIMSTQAQIQTRLCRPRAGSCRLSSTRRTAFNHDGGVPERLMSRPRFFFPAGNVGEKCRVGTGTVPLPSRRVCSQTASPRSPARASNSDPGPQRADRCGDRPK